MWGSDEDYLLWVLTSTIHEGKGILTDVFNRDGKYLDNFYLFLSSTKSKPIIKPRPIGYPPMTIDGNYLYIFGWDENGNTFIVKYKIID